MQWLYFHLHRLFQGEIMQSGRNKKKAKNMRWRYFLMSREYMWLWGILYEICYIIYAYIMHTCYMLYALCIYAILYMLFYYYYIMWNPNHIICLRPVCFVCFLPETLTSQTSHNLVLAREEFLRFAKEIHANGAFEICSNLCIDEEKVIHKFPAK